MSKAGFFAEQSVGVGRDDLDEILRRVLVTFMRLVGEYVVEFGGRGRVRRGGGVSCEALRRLQRAWFAWVVAPRLVSLDRVQVPVQ